MKKSFGYLVCMAGLALGLTGQVMARDYPIQNVTVLWSALSPQPTASDTITITDGGVLYVDVSNATADTITIGDGTTAGSLLFDSTSRILTVKNVQFGSNPGNQLNMSSGTAVHTLRVSGDFLPSGAGAFNSGLGVVVYNGAAQTVTAKIGATTIQYKDLTLAGSGAKTLQNGVTVQGKLSIQGTATVAGSFPVTYGGLASLEYNGSGDQTTTGLEWPAPMPVSVTITKPNGVASRTVKLDSSKALNGALTIDAGCTLNNDGKDLTARGNIANNGTQTGAGRVVLAGTAAQSLSGAGRYANLTLSNGAGATAPTTGLFVDGRLVISSGRLTLAGNASTARLLTLGTTAQQNPGTYGSATSSATFRSDVYFAGTGLLTLGDKFDSAVQVTKAKVTYGTPSVNISGKVDGGEFGNNAVDGEAVTVTIRRANPPATVAILNTTTAGGNGSYSVAFDTSALPAGTYEVRVDYAGGISLASSTTTVADGLTVERLKITVTPDNKTKVYANADPALTYTYSPQLIGGDGFSGNLTRTLAGTENTSRLGEQVGNYPITQGTLSLPANYELVFTGGRTLTITPRPVSVVAVSSGKTYGEADPAAFNYTTTPVVLPVASDQFQGVLQRPAGEDVADYPINQGTLKIVSTATGRDDNYTINYTPATFRINRKNVIVGLAAGSQSKTYGQNDPDLNPSFTPALVLGDEPRGKLKREAGENAGNYPVNMGDVKIVRVIDGKDVDKTANYNLPLQQPLNFVINPKALNISAVLNPQKFYGDAVPALIVYDGLIAGQSAPQTPATVGNWKLNNQSVSAPTATSLPGAYQFEVLKTAADSNYAITYGTVISTLTIVKRPLTVTAENKSKVEDGAVFPGPYTATGNFVAGDTFANSTGGSVKFTGPALIATAAGVYEISVATSDLTSDKYGPITYVSGSLVITKGIATITIEGNETWGGGGSFSWTINQANGGNAGSDPGWKLLHVKKTQQGAGGVLTIGATEQNKFTIFLTTLVRGQNSAGSMSKFDPSRPYVWKIAQAESISGFAANKFNLVWQGSGFFANPTFGGTFGIEQWPEADPKEIRLTFTPKPQLETDVPALLGYVRTSDLDVLYLEPSKTSIVPQEPVTIALKVANLQQPVFGAQAFINFSSAHFNANQTGAGAPVVAAGGGVWDNVIYRMWNAGGDLDTVIGLSFTAPLGTTADGTVALITLTPTRTTTGKSRVVFRGDTQVMPGGITGGTQLSGGGGSVVLPARVPTDDITIVVDDKAPVINSVAVTQVQYGETLNIKNGGPGSDPARPSAVRGTVNITVNAKDLPGVGLNGAPTVKFTGPSGQIVNAEGKTSGANDGDFLYTLAVDGGTENGRWNAVVTATDMLGKSTTDNFYIHVNKNEVKGVVEVEALRSSTRRVTFALGDGAAIRQTRTLELAFTESKFMQAGGFRDLPALANELLAPKNAVPMSIYLRYGAIADLDALANRLLLGTDGFASYMRDLLFGYVTDLTTLNDMAAKLKSPTRSIDAYILARLSPSTIQALNNYPSSNPSQAQIAALENGLLNDFTSIALGPSIYDPLRFQSVPLVKTDPRIQGWLPPNPTPKGDDLIQFNRYLLEDAYPRPNGGLSSGYVSGALKAQTAQALVTYTGGDNATLAGLLLLDFDRLTQPSSAGLWGAPSLYTEQRFLGIPLRQQTANLILQVPPVAGSDLVLLNRLLLEDGFAASLGLLNYTSGPLTPATAAALATFAATPNKPNQQALEPLLVADLNKVLDGGVIRRSDLEAAYPEITRARTLAAFTLIDVPEGTTLVSAKTSWNLRETVAPLDPPVGGAKPNGVANFVNGANVQPIVNNNLRAGDVNGDNIVNLSDFNVLQQTYGTTDPRADFDGSGAVNIVDYTLLQNNFGAIGDLGVDGKP
jgi:hypothetical protein